MTRRLLNFLTLLSLLLCVATAGLWLRSHLTFDEWEWTSRHRRHGLLEYHVFSQNGRLAGYRRTTVSNPFELRWEVVRMAGSRSYMRRQREDLACEYHLLGFGYNGGIISRTVVVPYWFLTMLLAVVPSVSLVRRMRRRNPGQCRRCGYDLRATPDRCPEYGVAVT